jgi:hypothetical protein
MVVMDDEHAVGSGRKVNNSSLGLATVISVTSLRNCSTALIVIVILANAVNVIYWRFAKESHQQQPDSSPFVIFEKIFKATDPEPLNVRDMSDCGDCLRPRNVSRVDYSRTPLIWREMIANNNSNPSILLRIRKVTSDDNSSLTLLDGVWQPVLTSSLPFYVYSAFFDTRFVQTGYGAFVRILAAVPSRYFGATVTCKICKDYVPTTTSAVLGSCAMVEGVSEFCDREYNK